MVPAGYQPLTETTVVEFVRASQLMGQIFAPEDELCGQDLADGNVNLVYRVMARNAPERSVIVKQALPYARVVGESFPMPLERARIEAELLELEGRYCPSLVPKIYLHDATMHAVVMEDLHNYIIMRKGLMAQQRYPSFAEHIGTFMARTFFYTSDLYLAPDVKKAMAAKHINPGLCKVTEDLVFTDPYMEHPGNRHNPLLEAEVARIRADERLRGELFWLKEVFMTKAEALIHGDLHTGSIMVNECETKVIDPEFAFYGPMAFDSGLLMANLALSYCAQEYHASDAPRRSAYRDWLLATMRQVWQVFEREFRRLWDEELHPQWGTAHFREAYLKRLLRQTAGFGSAEVMRRVLGLAHVADLDSIPELEQRAAAERMALAIGRRWLLNYRSFETIDDLLEAVSDARAS